MGWGALLQEASLPQCVFLYQVLGRGPSRRQLSLEYLFIGFWLHQVLVPEGLTPLLVSCERLGRRCPMARGILVSAARSLTCVHHGEAGL